MKESKEVRAEEPAAEDETRIWLRSLDEAKAAAPEPEERLEEQPDWMKQDVRAEETPAVPPVTEPTQDETAAWLRGLEEEAPEPVSSHDDTAMWLKSLDEEKPEELVPQPTEAMQPEELPDWMQGLEAEKPAEESVPAAPETSLEGEVATEWMSAIEQQPEPDTQEPPNVDTGSLPSWLRGLDEKETKEPTLAAQEDLPAWLRDETGELVAEPTKIEPTRASDWQPIETEQPELESTLPEPIAQAPEPEATIPEPVASVPEPEAATPEPAVSAPEPEPVDVVAILEEKIAAPMPEMEKPTPPAKPLKEPVKPKGTGALTDPVLGQARSELSRSNLPSALENYDRLIKKGRFLEDVIYDLREASYHYPVDVNIWQSLGDAYMRSNRLQDALDAYTKAEELLR